MMNVNKTLYIGDIKAERSMKMVYSMMRNWRYEI